MNQLLQFMHTCWEPKKVSNRFNFREDNRDLPLYVLLLYSMQCPLSLLWFIILESLVWLNANLSTAGVQLPRDLTEVILCFSLHFWNFDIREVLMRNATGHVWFAFSTDLDDEANLQGGKITITMVIYKSWIGKKALNKQHWVKHIGPLQTSLYSSFKHTWGTDQWLQIFLILPSSNNLTTKSRRPQGVWITKVSNPG